MPMEGQIGWQHLQGGSCPRVEGENNNKAAKEGQEGRKGRGRTGLSEGGRSRDAGAMSDAQPHPKVPGGPSCGGAEAGSCSRRFSTRLWLLFPPSHH